MSEWGVALIAAGSAVAGSIVTGWYTRSAGIRQAEAAKHAGDRQADALLHTVQATLDEQRRTRIDERRRHVYTEFLKVAEDIAWLDASDTQSLTALLRALSGVSLEGPLTVEGAAHQLAQSVKRLWDIRQDQAGVVSEELVDLFSTERSRYMEAVRTVLNGVRLDGV
ncbi:hypothetical protein [Streptomyces sp. DSM 118148]|uniref:hypothetical protein n=1 Tax=Streptomyces sp. DSM 118148 TaxID=3448667 RepID=UPI0040401AD5